jgi:hypothetical protein
MISTQNQFVKLPLISETRRMKYLIDEKEIIENEFEHDTSNTILYY